jgi:hypothetical protein
VKLFTNCDAVVYCADDRLISDTINPILEVAQEMAWSAKNAHHTIFLESVEKVGRRAILKTVAKAMTSLWNCLSTTTYRLPTCFAAWT